MSYWLVGIRKEELDTEDAPLFVEHLRNAQWKLGDNPRPSVVFHVTTLKASRHRQLRWGDEYAHFFYIDAFAAQAAADLGIRLHALEEVEQPTGAEPAQVVKLPTTYWDYSSAHLARRSFGPKSLWNVNPGKPILGMETSSAFSAAAGCVSQSGEEIQRLNSRHRHHQNAARLLFFTFRIGTCRF